MRAFEVNGKTFSGYLAIPKNGSGPGVVVLHAWWGLTEPFQRVCDRLAQAGFVALAPDLYHLSLLGFSSSSHLSHMSVGLGVLLFRNCGHCWPRFR